MGKSPLTAILSITVIASFAFFVIPNDALALRRIVDSPELITLTASSSDIDFSTSPPQIRAEDLPFQLVWSSEEISTSPLYAFGSWSGEKATTSGSELVSPQVEYPDTSKTFTFGLTDSSYFAENQGCFGGCESDTFSIKVIKPSGGVGGSAPARTASDRRAAFSEEESSTQSSDYRNPLKRTQDISEADYWSDDEEDEEKEDKEKKGFLAPRDESASYWDEDEDEKEDDEDDDTGSNSLTPRESMKDESAPSLEIQEDED